MPVARFFGYWPRTRKCPLAQSPPTLMPGKNLAGSSPICIAWPTGCLNPPKLMSCRTMTSSLWLCHTEHQLKLPLSFRTRHSSLLQGPTIVWNPLRCGKNFMVHHMPVPGRMVYQNYPDDANNLSVPNVLPCQVAIPRGPCWDLRLGSAPECYRRTTSSL